jgi:HK97 family phage major capsid protein
MDIETTELETKAGIPAAAAADAAVTHSDMMRAFEAFKEANDQQLAAMAKSGGDVVLEEKVARINSVIESHQRFIDDAKVKAARPALGEVEKRGAGEHEYKSAFDAFVRHGDSSGLRELDTKALSAGSNADGGFVVPPAKNRRAQKKLNCDIGINS